MVWKKEGSQGGKCRMDGFGDHALGIEAEDMADSWENGITD